MRTTRINMVAALLLMSAAAAAQESTTAAAAQGNTPKPVAATATSADTPLVNQIDFGFRGTAFGTDSDRARFERYRDLRDGGVLDRLRVYKDTDGYRYSLQADNVGYRDQRFSASYMNFGKVKASFEWNQIPLFYSDSTRTLYDRSTPGLLTLSDPLQSGIQNKTLTLADALTGASAFELRTRRDVASFALTYSATPNIDFTVNFRNTQKTGAYPWGGSFGISGAIATELPVPVDHRTTELGTSLEYANDRGYARIGYDGSFFHNNVTTLTWDNPSRISDSSTLGPAQGRMALWPNTEMNTVSAAGGLNLPGRSHATAFLSVASLTNDNVLLPYTINSALVSPALDRQTSDVKATVTSMNYAFTSRPVTALWFSARYRQYEFDNRTVPFNTANSVNYDTAIVALNSASEPYGATRHTFDADASFTPVMYLGLRVGYTREEVDRTYRIVENTTENIARASVDLTGVTWLTVRGVYEHSNASGLAGRSARAAGDRRTADTAAVRHFGPRSRSGQCDRAGHAAVAVLGQRLGRHRPPGVPGHEPGAAQQRQPRLLDRLRLRPVQRRLAWRQLRLREIHGAAGVAHREPVAGQYAGLPERSDAAVQRSAAGLDRRQRRPGAHRQRLDGSDQGAAEHRHQVRLRLQPGRVDLHLRSGAEHRRGRAGAAVPGRERTAARDHRRPLFHQPALRRRPRLLVRQVPGGRLRVEPGRESCAAGDRDADADAARIFLSALYREHGGGPRHGLLVIDYR